MASKGLRLPTTECPSISSFYAQRSPHPSSLSPCFQLLSLVCLLARCANASEAGTQQRITFRQANVAYGRRTFVLLTSSHASAWPRDASSRRHLSLLAGSSRLKLIPQQADALPSLQVRRGDYPTTNSREHINATP